MNLINYYNKKNIYESKIEIYRNILNGNIDRNY